MLEQIPSALPGRRAGPPSRGGGPMTRLPYRAGLVGLAAVLLAAVAAALLPGDEPKASKKDISLAAETFDKGRKWAVLIGVNDYLDTTIPKLHCAVADARLMAKA